MEDTDTGSYAFSNHTRWASHTVVPDAVAEDWITGEKLVEKYPQCFMGENLINKYFVKCGRGTHKTYIYRHDNSYYLLVEKQ